MKAEYRRDLQNNYLILEVTDTDAEDNYCLHMAEENEIPGLLRFHSSRKDGNLYLSYDITSKQSLDSVYAKKMMRCEDLIFILCGIREVLDMLQKYLLNPTQLIFDPQYVYVSSNKTQLQLCYLPGSDGEGSVALLAEFLLKRLNHEDRRAVELGYRFYQETLAENFSLKKALRELLYEERENGWNRVSNDVQNSGADRELNSVQNNGQDNRQARKQRLFGNDNKEIKNGEIENSETENNGTENNGTENNGTKVYQESGSDWISEEYGTVAHKTHRKREKSGRNLVDKIFQAVHPAVLLSTLFLLAVLEIVFYFGIVNVTEAGGLFFLLLSAEMLINQCWKRSGQKKQKIQKIQEPWVSEGESEMYRMLQEEMYQMPSDGEFSANRIISGDEVREKKQTVLPESRMRNPTGTWFPKQEERQSEFRTKQEAVLPEEEEETRCLAQPEEEVRMRLVCMPEENGGRGILDESLFRSPISENCAADTGKITAYPDIIVGRQGVVIGKIRGESDVILDSPTVSRVHARLEARDGKFYVKDLNSRNGTFCNGERLNPQEQREIFPGDQIMFAEITYLAAYR